jgi:hypothetical protein
MILINLLPPELRKRRAGIPPIAISIVAGGLAALVMLGFWAHVRYERIPAAQDAIKRKDQELKTAKEAVAALNKMKDQITQIKAQAKIVTDLIGRKQYWARTLDEFNAMLSTHWNRQGFEASAADITFGPERGGGGGSRRPGASAPQAVFSFKTRFKLIGNQYAEVGDYINEFFKHIAASDFWVRGNFLDKPDRTYRSFSKNWREDIGKVVVDMPLEFVRAKDIPANWSK